MALFFVEPYYHSLCLFDFFIEKIRCQMVFDHFVSIKDIYSASISVQVNLKNNCSFFI